ncbi:MAG: peroxidase-related enzyme [Actinomycetota bacterium]|nr:peroxidase-related enzyme [Actinomycetota bacterium]
MSHLPSLGDDAVLLDIFRQFPATAAPLLDYHQVLLRGPSPFTVAQRELIAAYVSALNACDYCHGVHAATAAAFGVSEDVVTALVADPETAPVDEPMKPVLRLVRTLTLNPSKVRDAEVAAVYAAGWDERALHDAVSVCALFNFMNRLVEGLGITAAPDYYRTSSARLAGKAGYSGLRHLLSEGAEATDPPPPPPPS